MKFKFFEFPKNKQADKEKCEYYFKTDKGKYLIEYEVTTNKSSILTAFDLVKNKLPGFRQKENTSIFKDEKEIIIDSKALPKIEKTLVTVLNPNKVFTEIKKDLPNFKHYNVKLTYASVKQIEEHLFFMKVTLEGLCNE